MTWKKLLKSLVSPAVRMGSVANKIAKVSTRLPCIIQDIYTVNLVFVNTKFESVTTLIPYIK